MFSEWPVLEYGGLCLRKTEDADMPYMADLFEYPLGRRDCRRMVKAFENRFERQECIVLGIYERDAFKGVIEAYGFLGGTCQIGYRIRPACRKRGYASRAAVIMCGFLAQHGLRVMAHCSADNAASRKVLETCGFRPSGRDGGTEYMLCLAHDDPKEGE